VADATVSENGQALASGGVDFVFYQENHEYDQQTTRQNGTSSSGTYNINASRRVEAHAYTPATGSFVADGVGAPGVAFVDYGEWARYHDAYNGSPFGAGASNNTGSYHERSGPRVWTFATGYDSLRSCDGTWDDTAHGWLQAECIYG